MKLTKVTAKNFLSHKDTTLEFTETRMQVAGENGSGKTSLTVDAPLWALFGRARASTTDNLMGPWGKAMAVLVEFEHKGHVYRVSRERGSKPRLDLVDVTAKNVLTEKHVKMTQEKIEGLVGSESAFVNTVVFKQGDALRFALATPSERKALFDELLDIEAFSEVERRANARVRGIKVEEDRLENELHRLTEQESQVSKLRAELGIAETRLESAAHAEELKSEDLQEARESVDRLVKDAARKRELDEEFHALELKHARFDQAAKEAAQAYNRKHKEINDIVGGTCPTCGQVTWNSDAVKARVEEWKKELEPLRDASGKAHKELYDVQAELRVAREAVDKATTEVTEQYEDAVKARDLLQREYDAAARETRQRSDHVATLKGRLTALETDVDKIDDVRKELSDQRQRIAGFKLIAEAFSRRGIPRELTRGFVDEVQKAANALLVGLTDMTVRISLEKEHKEKAGIAEGTVDVIVKDVAGERKVEMLSGGEKMRIMLGIRLAIAQVMAKRSDKGLKTLILDESLDGLDANGRDAALTMLTGMTGSFDRMLFITHDPSVAGMFPNRVELHKLPDGASEVKP